MTSAGVGAFVPRRWPGLAGDASAGCAAGWRLGTKTPTRAPLYTQESHQLAISPVECNCVYITTDGSDMRASDRAYSTLRDEILEWRLAPGTVLAEVEQA